MRKRSSEPDYYSSSSHDSFAQDSSGRPASVVTAHEQSRDVDKSRANSRNGSHANSRDGSIDLLMTSCDPKLLRKAKSELSPNEMEEPKPYRKLSLTPNLPRLEQRTSLNNQPLKKHTHKLSTSEESDLFMDSDLNLYPGEHAPSNQMNVLGIVPRIVTQSPSETSEPKKILDSQSTSSTSSLKSKGSANSGSRVKFDPETSSASSSSSQIPNGAPPTLLQGVQQTSSSDARLDRRTSISQSSPSLSGGSKLIEGEKRFRTFSEGATRTTSPDTEPQSEPDSDKLPELSVTDKRKTFAFKNQKRKQNLLTPKVLTDIGERSDNSDQSFDYGDTGGVSSPESKPPIGGDGAVNLEVCSAVRAVVLLC